MFDRKALIKMIYGVGVVCLLISSVLRHQAYWLAHPTAGTLYSSEEIYLGARAYEEDSIILGALGACAILLALYHTLMNFKK